jgi:hypothetical protein
MYLINLFVALSSSIHANLKVDVEVYFGQKPLIVLYQAKIIYS